MVKIVKRKLPQYEVRYKGFKFQVVVFPKAPDLWCYSAHPSESTYDIDGSVEGMENLADAFLVAVNSPGKLVYLPIKKNSTTFNVVFSGRPVDGFRPSVWYKIKPLLDSKRRIQNYRLSENKKKVFDYVQNKIEPCENTGTIKKDMAFFSQKLLGDTIFMKFSRRDSYRFWQGVVTAQEDMRNFPERITECWGLGFVLNKGIVESMEEISEWQ